MTPLRRRMIEDMTLAGLAPGSQDIYIKSVRRLAAHYQRSPDELSEEEVRSYLIRCYAKAIGARSATGLFSPAYRMARECTRSAGTGGENFGRAGSKNALGVPHPNSCRA